MRKVISYYRLLILYPESGLEGVFMARSVFLWMGGKDGFCYEEAGWELRKNPLFNKLKDKWVSSYEADYLFSCSSFYLFFCCWSFR